MDQTLTRLSELVTELNTTNSNNEKMDILAKYPDLREILSLIYSDFKQFGVTSKNVLKLRDQFETNINDAFGLKELLEALSSRFYTGHNAIKLILDFIDTEPKYEELILNALDKNLKCRIDVKMINKVFPGCVPTFDVALAKALEKVTKKPDFKKDVYYASRKLDGLRCVTIVSNSEVTTYSRTGKEFNTLQKVRDQIKDLCKFAGLDNVVFDGEICIVDEFGNEDFTAIMKEYSRKDHTIENPRYCIFDLIDLKDFENKKGDVELQKRLMKLSTILNSYPEDRKKHLTLVKQTRILDDAHFEALKAEGIEKGWEGIMIRKSVGYEGKRSNNLIKVKSFQDDEFVVTGIETGPFRVIDAQTGLEKEIETLTRVNIEYKGNVVGVGSGFSIDQRKEFYEDPSKIIGKTITVKYFSESQNEKGEYSLRFPTIKAIYDEKRNI